MVYSIIIIFSFGLGFLFSNLLTKFMLKIVDKKESKKVNDVYKKLLDNVYDGKTSFNSRVNDTVSIDSFIEGEGKVNILYMMDKKDIAIFKEDVCIYTSESVSAELLDEIINTIDIQHKDKIDDIINMMGFIFSKEEFEKKFNLKVEDLKNNMRQSNELSDIDKIIEQNENNFDIDYILDRINKVGIDNLTPDEKEFLDNYNKN
jgi:hypothetical protein